jgi:cation:H+ antiporter
MQFALLPVFLYTLYLCIALFVLVRSSGLFLSGAKKIGSSFGLSQFTIGVLIVAFGTSLPELASSIAGVVQGSTEVVVASVVGSNVANILLIVGLLACLSGKIVVTQELIKTELPIFFIATAHFVLVVYDGVVDAAEGILLLGTFVAFAWYLLSEAHKTKTAHHKKHARIPIDTTAWALVCLGAFGVFVGAKYSVGMTVALASALSLPIGLISIAAIALGTSLPELFVAWHAFRNGEVELAIGTVFGANVFNILVVIGIPALLAPLVVEPIIRQVGLPVLIAASMIFFVAGLSRQIMRWEGIMMILFFVFFVIKLTTFG